MRSVLAITNHVQTAVFEASKQKGMLYPLRMEKDGTHIMGYEWTLGDVTYVLDIRIAVNKRRQMAVSAMFHIKGDGLHAKLAPEELRIENGQLRIRVRFGGHAGCVTLPSVRDA